MCGWIKKKPSTQGAVWPFYSAVNNQRYNLARGLPDGNLHTDRAVCALPAQEIFLNFQVCVNMEVLPEQLCMNFLHCENMRAVGVWRFFSCLTLAYLWPLRLRLL